MISGAIAYPQCLFYKILCTKIGEEPDFGGHFTAPFTIKLTLKVDALAPKLTTLKAEVSIDSNDSVLENLNNRANLSLFVGRFVYLPMIQR